MQLRDKTHTWPPDKDGEIDTISVYYVSFFDCFYRSRPMPWMALMCHTKRTGPNRIWRTRTRQWKWQRRRERKKIIRSRRQYERTIASSLPSAQINPHHSFGAHKLTTEIKALPFFGFGFCKSTEDRCVVSFYTNTIKTPTHKLEVLFIFCSVFSFFLSGKKEEKKTQNRSISHKCLEASIRHNIRSN